MPKMDREQADKLSLDPLANYQHPEVRMRNRRGQYQSIDFTKRTNESQYSTSQNFYKKDNGACATLTKAENRLRIIEQISKFREDKIKNEFIKLENELKLEEERNKKMQEKELRK